MKRYQSLVLQELDIAVPGLCIRRLALHRHLPETTDIRPHSHRHAQCLLYVTGRGHQEIGGRRSPVRAGTACFVPPRVEHAFHRAADRRPVCLVLDLDWRGASRKRSRVAGLSQAAFRDVQQQLTLLIKLRAHRTDVPPLRISAAILCILDLLLVGLGLTNRVHTPASSPLSVKVERLLNSPDSAELSVSQLAHRVGYQQDHLNRLLKQQTGMTLGQMRARHLLVRAQQRLRSSSAAIGRIAGDLGFPDANYFARWFRRQTGHSPTHWRRRAAAV